MVGSVSLRSRSPARGATAAGAHRGAWRAAGASPGARSPQPPPSLPDGAVLVVSDCQLCVAPIHRARVLLDDLADHARADRTTALADGETQTLVHGDRLDQFDLHLNVVAGHDHLDALGQLRHPGDVGGAEVELRPVASEEGGVAAALLLLEHVDLGLELGVRRDRARLANNLATLDLLALGAAQQTAHVVAGAALVEDLAKH